MTVTFDIDGRPGALSPSVAVLIAENLRCFAAGPSHPFYRDVELLQRAGVDPAWTHGAAPVADVIEDTLVGSREGPIPLDSAGKGAQALKCALTLTRPASADATSEQARLLNTLRQADAT